MSTSSPLPLPLPPPVSSSMVPQQDRDRSNKRESDGPPPKRVKMENPENNGVFVIGRQKDKRLTDVLAENLKRLNLLHEENKIKRPIEGDIPALSLHNCFYVEGIRIGWPFPVVMTPQRQMAIHIIRGLKNRRHVVLESPTGTGKSAAILCSVLAWQRHHFTNNQLPLRHEQKNSAGGNDPSSATCQHGAPPEETGPVRIIYCSRTHSQVKQMVASLRKTPYRPRMAVLGSRDRLCIHEVLVEKKKKVNINAECRLRVTQTEIQRRNMYNSPHTYYDEENPPKSRTDLMETSEAATLAPPPSDDEPEEENMIRTNTSSRPTCSHYRELGPTMTAILASEAFRPPHQHSCSSNGASCQKVSSSMGTHDVEDLVTFGKAPHVRRGAVSLRRRGGETSLGLSLSKSVPGPAVVERVFDGGVAREEGLNVGDHIHAINGISTDQSSLDEVADRMRLEDRVVLDVSKQGLTTNQSPCPYYLARALARDAELIFCPYNYVLDPMIRESLGIGLGESVLILDEAHNVEGTLRAAASAEFGEFELAEMMVMLQYYASMYGSVFAKKKPKQENIFDEPEDVVDVSVCAHDILLFVECILTYMQQNKKKFESDGRAEKALDDWRQKRSSDDQVEMTLDGPTGHGIMGKAIGCQLFFEKAVVSSFSLDKLCSDAEGLDSHVRSEQSWQLEKFSVLLDRLTHLLFILSMAKSNTQDYFISTVAKANGSMEFAAGGAISALSNRSQPKSMPFVTPRSSKQNAHRMPEACLHPVCRQRKDGPHCFDGTVRHGHCCDGSTPSWEARLVVELLTPAPLMAPLLEQCRSVILASGSLAPLASLCAELGLHATNPSENKNTSNHAPSPASAASNPCVFPATSRLQVTPKPLEANHVIDLKKQLLAVSVGTFTDGTPLTVSYTNWIKAAFFPKLGDALATVVESIPTGGVLVFLPSYSFLKKCVDDWASSGVWERLTTSKGNVVVEPYGSHKHMFEEAKQEYTDTIKQTGSCVLLAVFRGKMSEGISFNDANARGVVCVGVPYPNAYDRSVQMKKRYNDEQRRLQRRTDLLPGNDWYCQQAYRAIGQALGRCIRHAADYGTIVLMDSRHTSLLQSGKLPKWMRHHVRNVGNTRNGNFFSGDEIAGWSGLRDEMAQFFRDAPHHARAVMERQDEQAKRAANESIRLEAIRQRKMPVIPPPPVPSSVLPESMIIDIAEENTNVTSMVKQEAPRLIIDLDE